MQIEALEVKRTPEGAIDIRHYARAAAAERRVVKTRAMRNAGFGAGRALLAVAAFVCFWNIPPMGGAGSKEMPYR